MHSVLKGKARLPMMHIAQHTLLSSVRTPPGLISAGVLGVGSTVQVVCGTLCFAVSATAPGDFFPRRARGVYGFGVPGPSASSFTSAPTCPFSSCFTACSTSTVQEAVV